MATYREKEAYCERSFQSSGPYWHLYTSGKQTSLIFRKTEDYVFGMNVVAQTSLEFPMVKTITITLMSNHIHLIASGEEEDIVQWFKFFRKKLARGLASDKICGICLPIDFQENHKRLADLNSLRNAIAYVNRNGYVVNPSYTPFSYPWSACGYYFPMILPQIYFKDLTSAKKREMFRGRVPAFSDNTLVLSYGISESSDECYVIAPPSYCAIQFGMAMFRDAHHYFATISKNVEAFSGVASEIEDDEFLTDGELFAQLTFILREHYQSAALKDLSKAQKLDLARTIRNKFRSSNTQISRVLGITQYEIDSLFPFGAKIQKF